MKMLHVAARKASEKAWPTVFRRALTELGDLAIVENGDDLTTEKIAELYRRCRIAITSWGSSAAPVSLAADRGSLKYICHLTGTMRQFIPLELIDAGIPVTNWGDALAENVAEGAMALLLATLQDLHAHIRCVRAGGWRLDEDRHGGLLAGANVGIYGLGAIGLRFVELIRPFRPVLRVYDPHAAYVPSDCKVVMGLDELFARSQIVVVHAALTDETRASITADLLAKLPDHGVLINTARGAIVDQEALLSELTTGRLRAGLDVTWPEPLPPHHPLRRLENVTVTAHQAGLDWPRDGKPPEKLARFQEICIDNIRRHVAGLPLQFVMTRRRYLLST